VADHEVAGCGSGDVQRAMDRFNTYEAQQVPAYPKPDLTMSTIP